MSFAIETEHLCRRFGQRLAVDRVSLQVPRGSVYGFLGRNGAGKTTTIRLLLGLLTPDAGSVRIGGVDVGNHRIAALRRVGVLLEAQGFYPHLSGREQLDLNRRLLGLPRSETDRVLELTEMRVHADRRIGDYSLGMRQRLGLSRALLGAPPVLILDEPTNGLDPEGIASMRSFLRSLPERVGTTVLLSSHLLGEIEHTASHVGMLCQGRLVLQGSLAALKAEQRSEVFIGTDRAEDAVQRARSQGFDVQIAGDGLVARFAPGESLQSRSAELNHLLSLAGHQVHTLAPREQSLEALYREAGRSQSEGSVDPAVAALAN